MTYLENNWAPLPKPELVDLVDEISSASSIESACISLAGYYKDLGCEMLSLKFCDRDDNSRVVRPYNIIPETAISLSVELSKSNGCPFFLEANRLLHPFELDDIDQAKYGSFLEKRFFKELRKTGHTRLAILPVMIGKGIAMAIVGLHSQPFSGALKTAISGSLPHIITTFIGRFPEAGTFFDQRILTQKEAEIVCLLCEGFNPDAAAKKLKLNEHSIRLILENAKRKLEADSLAQLVYKSVTLGEARPTFNFNTA